MATIGREGCTGMQAAIGAESSFYRLLVQIPGGAAKMASVAFMRAMSSVPSFRSLIYAYSQAFLEQVLIDADGPLDHVFFPDSGVVSAVAVYADGRVIEMATIGREGCTGMQAAIGAESSFYRLLVQIPGGAAKMSRAAFMRAIGSMPSFRTLIYA